MSTAPIMAHMVSHYPDRETSLAVARALLDAGVAYLEVQFPFSDPSADGPVIQQASTVALANGFKVEDGFALLAEITAEAEVPVYVMTYASLVVSRGVEAFCRAAAAAGVAGLIVPDLPFDYDEGLYAAGSAAGLDVVPVVVATIPEKRLAQILARRPQSLYVALRAGITGSETVLDPASLEFLDRLRAEGCRVFGGFGVRRREQVEALAPHLDAVVVGSQLVRTLSTALENPDEPDSAAPGMEVAAPRGSENGRGSGNAGAVRTVPAAARAAAVGALRAAAAELVSGDGSRER